MSAHAWSVEAVGHDRLRLAADTPESVVTWIREHHAVATLTVNDGSFDIVVREKHSVARLLRSIQDRLSAAAVRPTPALQVTVTHALPGRARFVMSGLEEDGLPRVAEWLRGREGVTRARPSPASDSVLVFFDPEKTNATRLAKAILESDTRRWPDASVPAVGWNRAVLNTGVLVASIALAEVLPPVALGVAIGITAVPAVRRAATALQERRIGVDALDVVAIGLSIATGRYATAALITWLLGLGDLVLSRTQALARSAISARLDLEDVDAHRLGEGDVATLVEARALRVGDRIIIETGMRVAADGVIESGIAVVDEKALTGESVPRTRTLGERVLSASIVVEGQIIVRVERVGAETTASKIASILAAAGTKPMTLQRNAERTADRLVLPTFALAGGTALLTSQIDRMTSVLITDFGTGLRIAVPTAALTAMTVAANDGILVKGGQFLERLSKADTIVFDKTGTLTLGEPKVLAVDVLGDATAPYVLGLAVAAEGRQHHPIARALRRAAADVDAPTLTADMGTEGVSIGRGVSAQVAGHSVVVGGKRAMSEHGVEVPEMPEILARHRDVGASTILVAVDGKVAAAIGVADEPRPESIDVIRALRANGRRRVLLLSGDMKSIAETVGKNLGVDHAEGDLLPEDKVAIVKKLQADGHVVAMVGDGLNDAPALTVADVGVSLGGSTDVAVEAADVVLLEGGLAKLPEAFAIADRGMRSVKRSLAVVLAPNAIAIVAGALGIISPAVAAAVNNGSTVAAALTAIGPLFAQRLRRRRALK